MKKKLLAIALVGALLFVGAACGDDDGGSAASTTQPTGSTEGGTLQGTIHVSAAASLTEAFTELGKQFETDHPGVKVELEFGPSSGLSDAIVEGSPSDVFASADETNMQKLVDNGSVDEPSIEVFAKNRPEMAVPEGNPGDVKGLDDFAREDLDVGLCAADVPCGKFARTVLENAGVTPSIDTNEVDVKALLQKIKDDDLDLGMVYHTDVVAAGDQVEGIEIPDDQNVIAVYPAASMSDSKNSETAQAFVDFVASADGQKVLEKYGFLAP